MSYVVIKNVYIDVMWILCNKIRIKINIGASYHMKTSVFCKNWPSFDCTEIFDEESNNSGTDRPDTLWTFFSVVYNIAAIPVNTTQHTFFPWL